MVVFGKKWLYSGNSGCIWATLVVFGQNGCIQAKVIVFGQGGCTWDRGWIYLKVDVFGQFRNKRLSIPEIKLCN